MGVANRTSTNAPSWTYVRWDNVSGSIVGVKATIYAIRGTGTLTLNVVNNVVEA